MNDLSQKKDELANLLWEEYKLRHELYWKSLYLWGGATTTVFMAPFLKPELNQLGDAIFIFPIVGLVLSLVGSWHLASEGERLSVVGTKYNQIRGESYSPRWSYEGRRTWYQQAISESVSKAVTILFTLGFWIFFLIDVFFLVDIQPPNNFTFPYPFIMGIVLVSVFVIGIILLVEYRRRKHNKSNDH